MIEQAIVLADSGEDRTIELARCLFELHAKDRRMLKEFIAASEVSRRKAYFLVEIGEALSKTRISMKRASRIGWTKLQIIGKHLSKENARNLLQLAESNTAHELKRLVRGDRPNPARKCVLLYFTTKQYAEFEKVTVRYGAKRSGRGLVDREEAILNIIRIAEKLP